MEVVDCALFSFPLAFTASVTAASEGPWSWLQFTVNEGAWSGLYRCDLIVAWSLSFPLVWILGMAIRYWMELQSFCLLKLRGDLLRLSTGVLTHSCVMTNHWLLFLDSIIYFKPHMSLTPTVTFVMYWPIDLLTEDNTDYDKPWERGQKANSHWINIRRCTFSTGVTS